MFSIFIVNVGSTSVKLALFHDETPEAYREAILPRKASFETISDVREAITEFMDEHGVESSSLDAVAARGGLLRPIAGGTYAVNLNMLTDLKDARFGMHASNLSAVVASDLASDAGVPVYVVDPVTVDELEEEARLTGIPSICRRSIFHALSQKAGARRACAELSKTYETASLIVAHMGGGISIWAHLMGRVVDVNNALDGEGPIAPERAGTIPAGDMARLCFSGDCSESDIRRMLTGNGGLFAYIGTSDIRVLEERINGGDQAALLVLKAIAYTIAKQIGAMVAVLSGRVDAVILVGGLARCRALVELIEERIGFIAPTFIYAENLEMSALAEGALRVLRGEEPAREY